MFVVGALRVAVSLDSDEYSLVVPSPLKTEAGAEVVSVAESDELLLEASQSDDGEDEGDDEDEDEDVVEGCDVAASVAAYACSSWTT